MKKVIALVLALIMCMCLFACGKEGKNDDTIEEKEVSVEEMVAQAEDLTLTELQKEMESNAIRAASLYNGKLVKFEYVPALSIKSDGVDVIQSVPLWLTVNLPKEELVFINEGDFITVVGTLEIGDFQPNFVKLKDAHLVQ